MTARQRQRHAKGSHGSARRTLEDLDDWTGTDSSRTTAGSSGQSPEPYGWRTTRRTSKLGKRLRREARSERRKERLNAGVKSVGSGLAGVLRVIGIGLGVVAVAILVLFLLVTGINATARWLAGREAPGDSGSDARAEQARENLLIIGDAGEAGANFLAVRLDEEDNQIFGIAIPSGAFMEVPGQGFERVGDSYAAGAEVSLAAVSNYLSVPFERYVVVDDAVYQNAVATHSLSEVIATAEPGNLSEEERAEIQAFIDQVPGDNTAIVQLPVTPIDLGGETFYEPQKEEIADLLLQWWGVKVGADDAVTRVIIYNGVGTPGIAGQAAQELITQGLRVVETRNADRFDYAKTLVVVQNGDVAQGDVVRDVLGVGEVIDQPSTQDVADVIVIIGADYKPPDEESTS